MPSPIEQGRFLLAVAIHLSRGENDKGTDAVKRDRTALKNR